MLLSESKIEDLRACAVYSDQLPADIVEKLSADSNYYVEEAFKLAKLPADWIGIDEEVISEKLKEGAVPNVVYEVLAENDTASIRALIAKSNGVPQGIINKLMEDENDDVKFALLERQLPEQWRFSDDEQRIEMLKATISTKEFFFSWQQTLALTIGKCVAVANSPSAAPTILKQQQDDSDVQQPQKCSQANRRKQQNVRANDVLLRRLPRWFQFGSCYLAELKQLNKEIMTLMMVTLQMSFVKSSKKVVLDGGHSKIKN